ncbi:MAG: ferredoxin [Myxococcota bacterium]|nr:ferredoxin [Myxococcota bacterium]
MRYKRRQNVTVDSATASALKAREEEEAAARPFRVIVDKDLCQGHAVCTGEAPEVFELGEDGEVQLSQEEPRRELRRKVEQAAQYCPNHVIRIEDL